MIKKGMDEHISKVPVSFSLYEIEKIAFCRTDQLLSGVLSKWLKNITQNGQQNK